MRPAKERAGCDPGPKQYPSPGRDRTAHTEDDQDAERRKHELLLDMQRSEVRAFLRMDAEPGIRTIDLDALAADLDVDLDVLYEDQVELGRLLGCTLDHYKRFETELLGRRKVGLPKRIRPFDTAKPEVDAYLAKRKRTRDREAAQRRRDRKRARQDHEQRSIQKSDLDPRDRAFLSVLSRDGRMSIRKAAERIRRRAAWLRPDGKMQSIESLRHRINERLPHLSAYIEISSETDPVHGLKMTMIRRRPR